MNNSIVIAVGQPDFEKRLVEHLAAKHCGLEFLRLGPIYFEDVAFRCEAPHRMNESGDAVAEVTLSFIAIEPSQCCSPAGRENAVVKLEVTLAAATGGLSFRTVDAPWHLLLGE